MTTTHTALHAADAVFMAEQAVGRARHVVEELHTTINSALRVLDDAELDSAKARLSDRGDYYLEAAGEHLSRLQRRCNDNAELTDELIGHLERASQASSTPDDVLRDADTTDPALARDVAQLKPRLAVVGEMIDLAKPMARLAAQHVERAHLAAQQATPRVPVGAGHPRAEHRDRRQGTWPRRRGRAPARERRRPRCSQRPPVGRHRDRDHRQRPPAHGRAGRVQIPHQAARSVGSRAR
ncbi:hypothetical protein [Nocardioides daphniae]|uniref:hypothetical protein n=1 Tax=Nocardioides daphniae TaxID=402297 RepID=UPI0013157E64|nr:hypothetical protein [Nocardioides daphniae]